MNSKYGTGASGIRMERSQPEQDERSPRPASNYYHLPRRKLTQEQRRRDEEIRTRQRVYGKGKLKEIIDGLN